MEIAPQAIAELGEVGLLEINDLNPKINEFQKSFVAEIKRLNDLERKLRFILLQAEKTNITIRAGDPEAPYAFSRSQVGIDELEQNLKELEIKLIQMNASEHQLNKRQAETRTDEFNNGAPSFEEDASLLGGMARQADAPPLPSLGVTINIGFVAGVIPRSRMAVFERILFRALRGNLFLNYAEINAPIIDPETDATTFKNVFIVFAHGQELINKIQKICESLDATIYPVDRDPDKRRENAESVITQLGDLSHVLENTRLTREAELSMVKDVLSKWGVVLRKEKAIWAVMNKMTFDGGRKALVGEAWCPIHAVPTLQQALRVVTERTGSTIPPLLNQVQTTRTPPTSQSTNRVTEAFQGIVDAYGVARYEEVNPGLFTVITFPFLFAVMFGDFGHGLIVSLFAGWMVFKERVLFKKQWGEMWDMLFGGRYIILFMGLFSMYTGLVYNDIFSQVMTLMRSKYSFVRVSGPGIDQQSQSRWRGAKTSTYGFGVDPGWHGAENFLIFSNSYKMKMAIIFGVVHMSFGIALQCYNHARFGNKVRVWGRLIPVGVLTEFLPQILFFWSIFGYLVFMIIFKWLAVYDNPGDAPGLLNTLIYMFLAPGTVHPSQQLYRGQAAVQVFLLFVAFITVPWMLLAKPYYELYESKRLEGYEPASNVLGGGNGGDGIEEGIDHTHDHNHDQDHDQDQEHEHGDKFDFSDAMIHQMIHTIEFTLSGISNTASYLRLWALSLAHAQLSEVLWEMVLVPALTTGNGFGIAFGFYMWFIMTLSILIGMEGLSAFLHALRLHWVEFQNKFYAGSGTAFRPFSFRLIFAEPE